MGVGSFKAIKNITKKVNETIGKVTSSKAFTNAIGGVSQVLRRFPTPQDVSNLPDPLKTAQWEAIFPSIMVPTGGLNGDSYDTKQGKSSLNGITTGDHQESGNAKWFSYNPICENINFTLPNVESVQLKLSRSSINLPTHVSTSSTFSAEFYCDNTATIISYFQTWRRMVVQDDQLVGYQSDYKKPVYLYLLGMKSVLPVYLIKFKGVYPKNLSSLSFKGDHKEDQIKVTITFMCDNITAEPLVAGQTLDLISNNFTGNVLSQYGSIGSIVSRFVG